jgi:hypothetical protein
MSCGTHRGRCARSKSNRGAMVGLVRLVVDFSNEIACRPRWSTARSPQRATAPSIAASIPDRIVRDSPDPHALLQAASDAPCGSRCCRTAPHTTCPTISFVRQVSSNTIVRSPPPVVNRHRHSNWSRVLMLRPCGDTSPSRRRSCSGNLLFPRGDRLDDPDPRPRRNSDQCRYLPCCSPSGDVPIRADSVCFDAFGGRPARPSSQGGRSRRDHDSGSMGGRCERAHGDERRHTADRTVLH